jgi:serine/threonine protein kinase
MGQILEGYSYLAGQNVMHRDLKPANILRIGNKWKISDFGFAVKSKYGFKDRINVGTPLYMAP